MDLLGFVLAAGLCASVVWEKLTLPWFVHLGLISIELAQPLRFALEGLPFSVSVRANHFLLCATMGFAVSLVNLMLAMQLPRCWPRGPWVRWMLGSLLGLGLSLSAAYLAWLWNVGMVSLSPYWAGTLEIGPAYLWVLAMVLLAFPVTRAAHHASPLPARASEPGEARTPVPGAVPGKASWRRRAGCYYHERFAVLAFLLVALTAFPVADLVSDLYHIFGPSRFKIRISGPLDLLWLIPSPLDASACFHTAVLLATIGALRATRHSPDEIHSADPQPLPPGRFAAAWAAQFLALVLGFPAFIAFAFGMTLVFY